MGKYSALLEEDAPTPKVGKYAALLEPDATTPDVAKPNASPNEALAPRLAQATRDGAGLGRKTLSAGLDALSLPGRLLASNNKGVGGPNFGGLGVTAPANPIPSQEDRQSMLNDMADTEGKSLPGKIIRDPALIPSLAAGGGALGLVRSLGAKGLGALSAAGAVEGAGSAAIHQADNVAQGRAVSPLAAAAEVTTGAALPGVGAGIAKVAKWGNAGLGKMAESLSGVSEEALRTHGAGFGKGAKQLQQAAGSQHEIGKKLVGMLDDLDSFLPEKQVVDDALQQMPAVNVAGTINRLQSAKSGGALASSRATNAKIDELASDLTAAADEAGNIPAAKFREIRKEIDDLVGDAFGKESGKYVSALKEARYQMADDLVKTAETSGMPEYADAMRSMAGKLRKADDLKAFLGKSAQTREQRAESFVSTLFGKNKEERRKAVESMGEIFGEDFIAQSKLAHLAAELGEEGKAGILPRQFTGRSLLGPLGGGGAGFLVGGAPGAMVGGALSSPRIAGGALTLGAAAEKGASRLPGLARPGRLALRPLFQGEDQNQ